MQRTAVIYGLALSTLVGAFLLVPRAAAPTPPEEHPPVPPSHAPVTRLVYGDGTLEVTASVDRGYLSPSSSEPLWMDVAVRGQGVATRAPLAAVLVIDRSGSMAGDKIDSARMAAERFVNQLRDEDALAIVSYGSDVTVDLPLVAVDPSARARALAVIRHIEEGGGTNIDGGLRAAEDVLANASREGRVARVVLVSDGRPTEGDRSTRALVAHAQTLRERGVTTSTLGLGIDYNEDLMEAIAVDGGGRYHYLRTSDQLARILDDELQHGANVVATGVRLHLPRELGGLQVQDAPGARVISSGDRFVVDVGDVAAGEERHVLIRLMPTMHGAALGFAAPELVYRHPTRNDDTLLAQRADAFHVMPTQDVVQLDQSRRDDVRVRVLQIEASLALTSSMQAWSAGDADAARAQLVEKKALLLDAARKTNNATLAAEARNLDDVLGSVSAAPAASAASQDVIKAQKARAFEMRR